MALPARAVSTVNRFPVEDLERLAALATSVSDHCPCGGPPPGLVVIVAHRPQPIRRVPISEPILVMVLEGTKEVHLGGRTERFGAGELLLLPAPIAPDILNVPDPRSDLYRALVVAFPRSLTERFTRAFPEACAAARARPADLRVPARPGLGLALRQLLECTAARPAASAAQAQLRGLAVLHAVVEECGCHLPLLQASDSPVDQLQALVGLAPGQPWSLPEAARRLGLSAATLRRRLSAAGLRFRGLVEEARLTHALQLLQTTQRAIGDVSAACGYASPSRFTARFRRRFGLTPSRFR